MIPARFDYEVAESVDAGDRAARLERRREAARRRPLAAAADEAPLRPADAARRHRPPVRPLLRARGRRPDRDRRAHAPPRRRERRAARQGEPRSCATTAAGIGDPQVRHRGTIGGSVAHGDPASDLPAVLLALEAELVARGPDGERTIAAGGLLHAASSRPRSARRSVLTEIRVPKAEGGWLRQVPPPRAGLGDRRRGRRALERLGARRADEHGRDAGPRAQAVEEALASGADAADAAERAAEGTSPPSDTAASAEFRQHLARVLTRRALEQALN